MIGKFVTGWKESTKWQKTLTFAKIAVTVAISTTLFVLSGGGLVIALLIASLLVGLLYYFAKDVINIAKEKLTSELSEACKGAINFECQGIKNASKGIIQTTKKIKNGLNNCKNDLGEQAANIEKLKSQIKKFEVAIEEEKKNKEKEIKNYKDQINKQKEKIAEITNNLASTISSSLTNSAQVEKKSKREPFLCRRSTKRHCSHTRNL